MTTTTDDLFAWKPPEDQPTSYLRPIGERRRGCMIFEKNPHWDGVLRMKSSARNTDRSESHDAAASVKSGDIYEARQYVDEVLAQGHGIISIELREHVLRGIAAGRIASLQCPANVRAESIRRRFSDLC